MLVGLFCLMGMNAFALTIEPSASNMIYKDGLVYIIIDPAATPQEVLFYGISKAAVDADADVAKTLVLNNDVTAAAPSTGVNTQYKVVGFFMDDFDNPTTANFWYEAQGTGKAWETVALTSVEDIEFNLTLKELTTAQVATLKTNVSATNDPASTIFKDEAWKPLTTKTASFPALKTFKLGDMRGVITLAEPLDIANIKSHVTTIDLSGVMNDGIDPVTVPANWATGFSALEKVTFPTTANVVIGENAFRDTPELATVTFGNGDVTIGESAFRLAPKLKAIDLTKVKKIGVSAFQASGLTAVTITADVEEIGADAFAAATNPQLKEVTYSSEKLLTIPAVFGDQELIEKVTVTGPATKIVANAFADATNIKEIHFENAASLATVPATVFAPTGKKLEKVLLRGSALTALPFAADALQNQTALTDFTFPAGLTGALLSFNGCTSLKNLGTIPDGVTAIPMNGFNGCAKLEGVDFDSDASGLISIGDMAFQNDIKLKSFAFAKTKKLQSIGVQAFEYCEALEAADLSGTMVKSIGSAAFRMNSVGGEWKTALATVSLPIVTDMTDPADATKPYTAMLLIGQNAFWGCDDLTAIGNLNQPKLYFALGGGQFAHSGLSGEINLAGVNHMIKDAEDNDVYQFTTIPLNTFYETDIEKVTLPVGVTTVGGYAFYGCESLEEVVYSGIENLASIGYAAFQGCALTTVDLSGAIGRTADDKDYLFKTIAPYTFAYNESLVTVKLPSQINEIGEGAFFNDVALANINLNQTDITYLNTIFSDYDIAGTKEVTLSALKSLPLIKDETITLSINGEERGLNPLLSIEDMALQFTGLTEFTMPETVEYETSGFGIFRACTNLKKFTWKNAKEDFLGVNFFRGDVKLEEVYFLTKETCDDLADDEIFFMCDMDKLTVYVTKDSYNAIVAAGMGNENRKFSTIAIFNNSTFQFTEKNLASDGYYYATYYDKDNSSWFDPEVFDVYSAVLDGSKIVLKPATVEGGYYKVARFDLRPIANFIWNTANDHDGKIDPSVIGDEDEVDYTAVAKAICVVRSQNIDAKPILNSNEGSEYASTLPTDNDLQYCWYDGFDHGSKLNFVYQLGRNKSGKVSFYRITSGDFKEGGVFVKAYGGSARAGLDIVIEGESTGINGIVEENVENDNAPIYNLQGVRVNSAKNGNLYIKNGKKFMK